MATFLKEANHSGSSGSHFRLALYYDIMSRDLTLARTTVRLYAYINKTSGYSGSGIQTNAYINGAWVGGLTSMPAGTTQIFLGQRDIVVQHDANGNGTLSYSASHNTGWKLGNASLSGSLSLQAIPRQATITTAPNINDEESQLHIQWNNFGGYDVKYYLEANNEIIKETDWLEGGSWGLHDFLDEQEKNLLRSKAPNSKTLTIKHKLQTNIGGNTNYWSSVDRIFTIIDAPPIANANWQNNIEFFADDELTVALCQTKGGDESSTIIKGVSSVKGRSLDIFTPQKYATIDSGTLRNESKVITYQYGHGNKHTFGIVQSNQMIISASDSRNLISSEIYELPNFINYNVPVITNVEVKRTTAIATETRLSVEGTFDNINFGKVQNTILLKFRYRELGSSEWSAFTNATPIVEGNNFSCSGLIQGDLLANGFSKDKTFEIQVQAIDEITTISKFEQLNSAQFNMVLDNEGGVAFGEPQDTANVVIKDGNIYIRVNGVLEPLFI